MISIYYKNPQLADLCAIADHEWIIIGDVSGHGVSAGLIMMMVQTAIHTVLLDNPGVSPPHLLSVINKTIYSNLCKMGEDKFMTIVVLALEQDGIFTYSGAHEDIIVWRSSTGTIEEIETNGMWIGLEPDISHFLKTDTLLLNPGDCMVLYTDGVTEARDENNDLFSNEKLGSLAIPVVAPNRIDLTCCNSMQYCFGINI